MNPGYVSASKMFVDLTNLIFGKVPFTPSPSKHSPPFKFKILFLECLASLEIIWDEGVIDKIGIKFKTMYDYPANTAIRVTLPKGYSTEDPKC